MVYNFVDGYISGCCVIWVCDSQFDTPTLCIYDGSPLGDPVSLGVQSALIVDQLSIQTNLILEQLANIYLPLHDFTSGLSTLLAL